MSASPKRKPGARRAKQCATARRRVSNDGQRRPINHIVLPGHTIAEAEPLRRETIAGFLRRTGWGKRNAKRRCWEFLLPTICVVNGVGVFQKDWRKTRIHAGDRVEFWSKPYGGSRSGQSTAKAVAGIVALVALSALSLGVGAAVAAEYGAFAGTASSAAIGLGGGLRIGALR